MKKYIIMFFAVISLLSAYSQNQIDALRYSQFQYGGSARFVAMGGSLSAIGADLSSMAINPAGLALYRRGEFNFTPEILSTTVKSSMNGTNEEDFGYGFNFSNLGIVGAIVEDSEVSDWKGVAFGFGYNRLANFNKSILIEGVNDKGSMIGSFVDNANAGNYGVFYESPAFETYLIDYDNAANEYWSPITDNYPNSPPIYGETQRKSISTKGGIGEYDFSMGVNYLDFIYLGATVGVQSIFYHEFSTYKETFDKYREVTVSTDTSSYTIPTPDYFTLEENLTTSGSGANLKLGIIIRPLDWVRVGAAYHSPTFSGLQDKFSTEFYSHYDKGTFVAPNGETWNKLTPNGNYSVSYPIDDNTSIFNYQLTTPSRFIGSLGFIIQKLALISFEFESVDYSNARLLGSDFEVANDNIQNTLVNAFNIRSGAELRFGAISLRGGFGYYGNPYNKNLSRIDASKMVFSGGLGLSSGNFYVDFAYSQTKYKDDYFLYNGTSDEPHPTLDFSHGIGMVTFGVKF